MIETLEIKQEVILWRVVVSGEIEIVELRQLRS
jgi:hypothetical protein